MALCSSSGTLSQKCKKYSGITPRGFFPLQFRCSVYKSSNLVSICGFMFEIEQICWFNSSNVDKLSSSVCVATDYGLDGPGSNPGGDEIFRPSRPAMGPTQSPVKWVPGLSRG